jgi:hypothetical protein
MSGDYTSREEDIIKELHLVRGMNKGLETGGGGGGGGGEDLRCDKSGFALKRITHDMIKSHLRSKPNDNAFIGTIDDPEFNEDPSSIHHEGQGQSSSTSFRQQVEMVNLGVTDSRDKNDDDFQDDLVADAVQEKEMNIFDF